MAIRGGLAVSVRGRVSSSTPWSQLAATFLGVDAGVDILQSWTAKVPCYRFCPCGSASEFGERERVGFRFLALRTRPVRHRRAGRYRSRRLLLARAATTCRRRAWDGQVRRQHGAEVVPAGTADRGDVLGGVSAGTVPTAGAVRESTTTSSPVLLVRRAGDTGSGVAARCLLAAGLGRSRAFDGEEPLVDLAEGDLDVAQASIHAADSSPTATTPPSSFSHRVVVCPCRHFRTVRGVGPSVPFISSFAPCGRSEPRSSCTANDTRHVRTRRSSTSPVVFRRRPGGPWISASGTSGRRLRPVPP